MLYQLSYAHRRRMKLAYDRFGMRGSGSDTEGITSQRT